MSQERQERGRTGERHDPEMLSVGDWEESSLKDG